MTTGGPPVPLRVAASGLVLAAGAGVYALAEGAGGAHFDLTPLLLGAVAIGAGLVGVRKRVAATGLVLAGWGVAVLLVAHGWVPPERTTPAYMLGIAAGLLAAAAVAGPSRRAAWLMSGSIVALTGPLSLYLSYDVAALGRWPLWAVFMLAWGAWELYWDGRSPP